MGDEEPDHYHYSSIPYKDQSNIDKIHIAIDGWYCLLIFAIACATVLFTWIPITALYYNFTVSGITTWALFETLTVGIALYSDHRVQQAKQQVSTIIANQFEYTSMTYSQEDR